MANYVWNKLICGKDFLEKYFIDYMPFGQGQMFFEPYITFNKLFDVSSLDEYAEKIGTHISYGFGVRYSELQSGEFEVLFCTKWRYPIEAIKKTLELEHNVEWYAVEENNIYVSKFYWDDGVKESVAVIHEPFYDWLGDNMSYGDELEDCDSDVWFFWKMLM